MTHLIEDTQHEVRRYWTADGIPDLYIGLGLLLYGLLSLRTAWGGGDWLFVAQALFLPLWFSAGVILLRRLKERLTYPRGGYVAYATPPRRVTGRRMMLGLGGAVLLGFLLLWGSLTLKGPRHDALGAGLVALIFALGWGAAAWNQRRWRYAGYALVALLVGGWTVARMDSLAPEMRAATVHAVPLLLALGGAMLLGGGWSFLRFRVHNPVRGETE